MEELSHHQDKKIEMTTTTQNYDDDDPKRDSSENHHLYFPPPPSNHQLQSDPYPSLTTTIVKYRECLKNHAASMGSHVVDGCGEFMPSGEDDTTESLRCAACGCHRNFHRKETEGKPAELQHVSDYYSYYYYSNKGNNNQRQRIASPLVAPSPLHQHPNILNIPPMMVAFGGGLPVDSSGGEDLHVLRQPAVVQASLSKTKRFRSKFTQEQKKRMMEYAEKLGWKIQKNDEQEVRQFCSQLGVNRQVFKVWMHNNKQRTKQQQV